MVKIFDATALIAFLSAREMDFPEGIEQLAKGYPLIAPAGVVGEITKPVQREKLDELIKHGVIKVIDADATAVEAITNNHPTLHRGESEAIAYAINCTGDEKVCILSDDLEARRRYPALRFTWTEELIGKMHEKSLIDGSTYTKLRDKLAKSTFYSRGKK